MTPVDAARPQRAVAEAGGLEAAHQVGAGHHGDAGAVVERAQPALDRAAQHADAVVPGVVVEVGVVAGGQRYAQRPRRRHRRAAERALGGDVDDVGPARAPAPHQHRARGQAEAQRAIAGDGQAGADQLGDAGMGGRERPGRARRLVRPHHLHLVPAPGEALDQARQRHRHAVDLGRPGLGHQRDGERLGEGLGIGGQVHGCRCPDPAPACAGAVRRR